MWLNVAEYNPNAVAFYLSYGFKKTSVSRHTEGGPGWGTRAGPRSRRGQQGREWHTPLNRLELFAKTGAFEGLLKAIAREGASGAGI